MASTETGETSLLKGNNSVTPPALPPKENRPTVSKQSDPFSRNTSTPKPVPKPRNRGAVKDLSPIKPSPVPKPRRGSTSGVSPSASFTDGEGSVVSPSPSSSSVYSNTTEHELLRPESITEIINSIKNDGEEGSKVDTPGSKVNTPGSSSARSSFADPFPSLKPFTPIAVKKEPEFQWEENRIASVDKGFTSFPDADTVEQMMNWDINNQKQQRDGRVEEGKLPGDPGDSCRPAKSGDIGRPGTDLGKSGDIGYSGGPETKLARSRNEGESHAPDTEALYQNESELHGNLPQSDPLNSSSALYQNESELQSASYGNLPQKDSLNSSFGNLAQNDNSRQNDSTSKFSQNANASVKNATVSGFDLDEFDPLKSSSKPKLERGKGVDDGISSSSVKQPKRVTDTLKRRTCDDYENEDIYEALWVEKKGADKTPDHLAIGQKSHDPFQPQPLTFVPHKTVEPDPDASIPTTRQDTWGEYASLDPEAEYGVPPPFYPPPPLPSSDEYIPMPSANPPPLPTVPAPLSTSRSTTPNPSSRSTTPHPPLLPTPPSQSRTTTPNPPLSRSIPPLSTSLSLEPTPPPIPPRTKQEVRSSPIPPPLTLPEEAPPTPCTFDSSYVAHDPIERQDSDVFKDMPTPKQNLFHDDPFKYSDFATVCHEFNRLEESGSDKRLDDQAQAVPQTDNFYMIDDAAAQRKFDQGQSEGSLGTPSVRVQRYDEDDSSNQSVEWFNRMSLGNVPPPPQSSEYVMAKDIRKGNGSALDVSDSESDETPFSNQRVPYITQNISARKNDKCGYLHKQGGVKANKGWRKRWVVFNGQDLRYYVNNKSQISKRIIPVSCMTDVMSDIKNEDTSRFRFRLITTIKDRVFHFSADDLDDCLTWTQTLMAAIQKYSNSSDEDIGSQKADKEGYIRFDDDGGRKYFVAITDNRLCYYQNKDEYLLHSPIHEIMMELASVKDGKTPGKLQLSTHYGRFMLSFDTSSDCQQWKMAMEDAIAKGLSDDSILEKVYENESNRICADCEAENPHWASINLGIVVCKKCAGIHRMFDVSVSKIRSLRMDTRVWTPSLVELMKSIGNANANNFWESEMEPDEKIDKNASTEERKEFIQTKYRVKKFCGFHSAHRNKNILNEELLKSAASDNVLNTMHIVFSGADVLYDRHGDTDTPYIVAKKAGERLQVEFLYQNFADESTLASEANDDNRVREDVRHQGYLLKTGPNMKGFDRRWCVLEHGAFTYYDSEKSTTAKDSVDRQFIYCVRCTYAERQSSAFEVSTSKGNQRSYLLAADGDGDRMLWMQALSKLICPVSVMEHVGMMEFTFAGNFYLKDSVVEDWRKTWIMLNGRDLFYYTKEQRLESVDLRKASSIKHQSAESCCTKSDEVGYNFVVNTPDRALYIQADLAKDTEKLRNAIETAVKSSGYSLEEQQLTSDNVPVIIDRCISHVTNEGLKTKGIYRESATQSRVLALLEELKKDPRSVRLELYTDHEVANALKKFVRELRTSVFTKDYTQWMNTAAINDVNSKIAWYKYLLDKMSDTHYNTLRKLVLHFNRILKYKSENQMTVENLATCFAPSLFVPENPEQLSFNVHSSLPSQLSVLVDIIAYHDQLFRLDETNTIEDEIEKAKERLKKLSTCSVRSSEPSNSLLISVSMFDISGQCELVNVNSIKTSGEIVDYLQSKRNIASHSLNIHEILLNGQLERPIHCQDCVFNDVIRWGDWPEDVRTGALLCLKPALLIEKIASYHDPSKYLLAELKCSEKKNFKKFTFDFKQSKFSCYKDSKATNCLWSFNAEEMIIYVGVDPRRSGIPSKFGFTFIMKGEKPTTKNVFGRSVCFQTEAELYTWLAALYMAKYTEGLVPL